MDEFIPLGSLLKKNTPRICAKKNIFQEEYEYSPYLGAIEFAIAEYFLNNQSLKDKEVTRALKNIKENYSKDLHFFKMPLEREVVKSLSVAIQLNPTTQHEFGLVIKYIVWSIGNRKWLQDSRAYLRWLCYYIGRLDPEREKEYAADIRRKGMEFGLPQETIENMLIKAEEMGGEVKIAEKIEEGAQTFEDDQKVPSESFFVKKKK